MCHLTSDADVPGFEFPVQPCIFICVSFYTGYLMRVFQCTSIPPIPTTNLFLILVQILTNLESINEHVIFIIQCIYFNNTSSLAVNSFKEARAGCGLKKSAP